MERPSAAEKPMVGVHIPWKTIEGDIFRITNFTPLASVEGDKVIGPPVPLPYGVLTVESPILSQPVEIPVRHREEFRNFWEFQGLIGDGERELLVSYLPARGLFAWLALMRLFGPRLHLRVRPRGELERYYAEDRHWRKPSAREVFFTYDRCSYCDAKTYRFSVRCASCKRAVVD